MKLRCTIGSIGIVGTKIHAEKGDEFEIDERRGQTLVKAGYAVELIEPPAAIPEPESTPPDIAEVIEQRSKPKVSSKRRK